MSDEEIQPVSDEEIQPVYVTLYTDRLDFTAEQVLHLNAVSAVARRSFDDFVKEAGDRPLVSHRTIVVMENGEPKVYDGLWNSLEEAIADDEKYADCISSSVIIPYIVGETRREVYGDE